ncbi:MAG TPA: proton-conducting transporter membrane subunit [Burkholderiaceae bacterium]|nr:proton-conducting transporter membrane subunit [Burkholderiaceae bacterium]
MTVLYPWLLCIGPLALLLAAAMPKALAGRRGRLRIELARVAAGVALLLSLFTLAAVAGAGALRTPPLGLADIGLGIYVDALSAMMFALVAFIGLIVIVYSRNYLDGEPRQDDFTRYLCATLAAILVVILAGNLLLFALAWLATSLCLHRLLLFYPQRRAAVLAARKKFIASRLGDACLLGAIVLAYRQFGSLDYAAIFAGARALPAGDATPWTVHGMAFLLVATALLKSAQFPLHGWIVEVMETPTPVSALLHAGIVNAGGFLVLRFSDVIAASAPSMHVLAVVGGFTAIFGSLVMLPQTSIKVSLAYSTIAQMGFMMLECGLGAFPAAMLHILAHSPYKAHAFLSSGSVIDIARASWTPSPGGRPHPARMVIAVLGVLAATAAVGALFGATVTARPGEVALGAVLVLSLILLVANGIDERPSAYVVLRAVGLALVVSVVYFVLQSGMSALLAGTVVPAHPVHGAIDLTIVVLVIASFGGVTVFQGLLPGQGPNPRWQRAYALAANGLYVNTLINRALLALQFGPQRAVAGEGGTR